jgi:serine protease SohB
MTSDQKWMLEGPMLEGPMAEHLRQLTARAAAAVRPWLPRRLRSDLAIVPVVRLGGVIGLSSPLRPGLSIASVARMLDRAFGVRNARAVALTINSPGGSAVQSHLIYRRIRSLAEEKKLPVIAFVEDVAASGGYMLACAADEIVCDPSSIVGSVGVIGASFGFPEAMRKLGIERRVYTAGEHKSTLDPFLPENEYDVARLKAVQQDIHRMFIALVRERRGDRLKGTDDELFTGEYWVAGAARERGLVDHLGDIRSVLRERFGADVAMPLVAAERSLFGRRSQGVAGFAPEALSGFAQQGLVQGLAQGVVGEIISALEARAMWARFGL